MRVTAYDQGVPRKEANVDVRVNVLRNDNDPEFEEERYEVDIEETEPYGRSILQVTATDGDTRDQAEVRHLLLLIYMYLIVENNRKCCYAYWIISSINR